MPTVGVQYCHRLISDKTINVPGLVSFIFTPYVASVTKERQLRRESLYQNPH